MEFQAKYRALATANALIACQTEAAVGIIKWKHTVTIIITIVTKAETTYLVFLF